MVCDKIEIKKGATTVFTINCKNLDGTAHSLASYDDIQMEIRKNTGTPAIWRGTLLTGELTRSGSLLTGTIDPLESDVKVGAYLTDVDLILDGVVTTPSKIIKVEVIKQITEQSA